VTIGRAAKNAAGVQYEPTPKSTPAVASSSEATKPRQQNNMIVLNELLSVLALVTACGRTFEIAFMAISSG
jgi:hypothetical protein